MKTPDSLTKDAPKQAFPEGLGRRLKSLEKTRMNTYLEPGNRSCLELGGSTSWEFVNKVKFLPTMHKLFIIYGPDGG